MNRNLAREIAGLRHLSNAELRAKYGELFGESTWSTNNRVWLIKRIAWRLQALAEGGLSERARRRAAELANEADLRLGSPRSPSGRSPLPASAAPARRHGTPMPGTILTRVYKGETLQVQVMEDGFSFEGAHYPSLSALAKTITGSHCSGLRFFGLAGKEANR
jgi:Protein of unknown function (DUF2924)